MRRHIARLLLSLSLFGAAALPAAACINDREIERKEREFKSHYLDNQQRPSPVQETAPTNEQKLLPYAALGAGSFLLVGAAVVCMRQAVGNERVLFRLQAANGRHGRGGGRCWGDCRPRRWLSRWVPSATARPSDLRISVATPCSQVCGRRLVAFRHGPRRVARALRTPWKRVLSRTQSERPSGPCDAESSER